MNLPQLIDQTDQDLQQAKPKTNIRKYGLHLLKTHHERIRKNHYLQYKKMIQKVASFYSRKYRMPLEELMAEGNLIYYEYFKKYSAHDYNCKFSTFLYNNLRNKLSFYCRKSLKRKLINHEIEQIENAKAKTEFEKKVIFDCSISQKSKEVVELITQYNESFAFYLDNGKPTQGNIRQYLVDNGWKNKEVNQSFAEIKQMLL
jgi:hypothetical protein